MRKSVTYLINVIIILLPGAATATELYVNTANPNCDQVKGKPYCTIESALAQAMHGDTILVDAGTYRENIDFNNRSLTLQSVAGPTYTTIIGQEGSVVSMGPAATLSGFSIRHGDTAVGTGIKVMGQDNFITNNIIENNTQSPDGYGAGVSGSDVQVTIAGNTLRNNSCDDQAKSAVLSLLNNSRSTIANNIIALNPCRAVNMTGLTVLVNNTIVGNRTAIYVGPQADAMQLVFSNNIIYKNKLGVDFAVMATGKLPEFKNNLVFGNTVNYRGITSLAGRAGNLSVNPNFADYAKNDYRLKPGSPAIDAGSVLYALDKDILQHPRPKDGDGDSLTGIDLGAYEIQPPVAKAGADIVLPPGAKLTLDGTASYDKDGQIIRFSWKLIGGILSAQSNMDAAEAHITASDAPGNIVMQLQVYDNSGLSAADTVQIEVNAPPIAAADETPSPIKRVKPGQTVDLKALFDAAADDNLVTYRWQQTAGLKVTLTHSNTSTARFTAPAEPTKLVFEVTLRNQNAATSTTTVDILVNAPPKVYVGSDLMVESGQLVALNGTFSNDPDGIIVKYHWKQLQGASVSITHENDDIAIFKAPNESRRLEFELTVTDDSGDQASDSIAVHVQ